MSGLTEKQRAARAGKLTASRIACLMTGDAAKIHKLWRQMAFDEPEPDLSDVWAVQLGIATEQLNLDWVGRKLGERVIVRGWFMQHPKFEWAGATVDGILRESNRPIEAKHVGGREPIEVIINRYQPQVQWIMECCASWQPNECALSVIMGANEPVIEWIPRDEEYVAEMVKRAQQFIQHVWNKTEPVALPHIEAPVIPIKSYDMTGNNLWAANAETWLATRDAAKFNKESEKELKEKVPDDAKVCEGHGVKITRDRAGRLSLREKS